MFPAREAAAPPRPIPYFAPVTGTIPPPGEPVVGGVRLPVGDRCGGRVATYWATFEEIHAPARLVSQLAGAFATTGLWPLCWGWKQDEVDNLFEDPPVPAEAIDALDAADVVARWWEEVHPDLTDPFGTAFPGLAAPVRCEVERG